MDALFTPFQYEFFRNGTIAAVLVGGLCGLVGVYIVLRGMSFIGHGLSHAVFGGAVVAFILQFNFYVGAVSWGFVAALLINQTVRKTTISADAAIGVVTTASFALGVALISRYRRFSQSFDAAPVRQCPRRYLNRYSRDCLRHRGGDVYDLLLLQAVAFHYVQYGGRPGLRDSHLLDRDLVCVDPGGGDHRLSPNHGGGR